MIFSNVEPDKPEPDSEVACTCHSFYGDSYSEALFKAAEWLSELPDDAEAGEPIVRLCHYSTYPQPFTCCVVVSNSGGDDEGTLPETEEL